MADLSHLSDDELLAMAGIDRLTAKQIGVESGGNPNAVSPKGAQGYMQIMPATAANPGYGVAPLRDNSPEENIRFGIDYRNAMLKKFGGDQNLALAAYNAGPGAVDNSLQTGKPLPAETRNYVAKIGPVTSDSNTALQQSDFTQLSDDELFKAAGIQPPVTNDNLQAAFEERKLAKPNNFMERIGMAVAGDKDQQTDVARQASLYSKNALQGLLSIPDAPAALANSGSALVRTIRNGKPFVENLGELVQQDPMAPNLGQRFGQAADNYTNNLVIPADNTESVIASAAQGVGAGLPFGPLAALGGATGGAAQQVALNNGLSPDQAALIGLGGSVAGMKAPSIANNTLRKAVTTAVETPVNAIKGLRGLDVETLRDTASDLKGNYKPNYDQVKNTSLGAEGASTLRDNIGKALGEHDLDPDLHQSTLKVIDRIDREAGDGQAVSVGQANTWKKLLSKVVEKDTNSVGKVGADGAAATAALEEINKHLGEIPELGNANAYYRAGSKVDRLTDIVQKGDGNITKVQQGIKVFLRNDKNLRGFTDSEISQLKKFSNGTLTEGVLGLLGKAGIDTGNLGTAFNTAKAGLAFGVPGAGPVVAAGTAAKLGLNAIKRGQLQTIFENMKKVPNAEAIAQVKDLNQRFGQNQLGRDLIKQGILQLPPAQARILLERQK